MRKTNEYEVCGLGNFQRFPIRKARQEFKVVNSEGKELIRNSEGTRITFFTDDEGKRYEEKDVFYLLGNTKVQKVKRTEKIADFKIVDKLEVFDLANSTTSILDYSTTTLMNFEREIGTDKAVKFLVKLSSRGFKWCFAYILKYESRLIMIESDDGILKSDGIKEFTLMKRTSEKSKTIINQVVEVKSEDLEKEITEIIKL